MKKMPPGKNFLFGPLSTIFKNKITRNTILNTIREILPFGQALRGKAGTDFIKELTRLILSLVHIFIPLMLQKPGPKSKAKDHVKYLATRLDLVVQR